MSRLVLMQQLATTLAVLATCACGDPKVPASNITSVPVPQLISLAISPKAVTLLPGATQSFKAAARWTTGDSTLPPVAYSADGGTVNPQNGTYQAPTAAGTYRVILEHAGGEARDTAVATVEAPPPPPQLISLVIHPKTITLLPGSGQTFGATALWSTGATDLPPVSFSTNGGAVNSSTGAYVAPAQPGTYRVIVAHTGGSARDTAVVTVQGSTAPPVLSSLTISPQSAAVLPGANPVFTVSAIWTDGSTTLPPLAFSATGGTINAATGAYTAPTAAGTYLVVVAHVGGTLRDTATITVTSVISPPPPTQVFATNLPANAGLQLITDSDFGNLLPDERFNADSLAHTGGTNRVDPSAPNSPDVYDVTYAGNNAGDGYGAGTLWGPERHQWRQVYFAMSLWLPANYSMHSNEEKFFYPLVTTNGQHTSSTIFGWYTTGSESPSSPTWTLGGDAQLGSPRFYQSSNVKPRKGSWQKLEYYIVMNSPGQSNGILRIWVNGDLAMDRSNMRYSNASTQSFFDGIRFATTRGGGASSALTPPEGQIRRYDRLAFFAGQ